MKRTKIKSEPLHTHWDRLGIPTQRIQILLLASAILLVIANILVDLKIRANHPPAQEERDLELASPTDVEKAVAAVKATLQEFHLDPNQVRQKDRTYFVSVPKELQFVEFHLHLGQRLRPMDGKILHTLDDSKQNRYVLTIGVKNKLAGQFFLLRKATLPAKVGRTAIIVDDFGYRYDETINQFICFPLPLTVSILPGLKESRRIAREAQLAGREVLLHMPMEPLKEKFSDDGHIILADHDPATIRLRLRQAFTLVPEAKGMNNHQGSRIIADRNVMTVVMAEMKRQNKFFIDSYTNPQSVALTIAKQMGVPCIANQIFLDAENDEAFIESQLERLAELSSKQGKAVGIAHARKRTLEVLKRKLPGLQARGIEFVYVSELLN